MKRSIEEAQKELADELLRRDGVSGVGIGADGGEPCLKVYLSERSSREGIPTRYRGHRVKIEGGGPFRAMTPGTGGER